MDAQVSRAVLASASALLQLDLEQPVPKVEAWKQSGARARSHKRKTQGLAEPAGQNARLLPLQTCCLGCSFVGPSSLLLVRACELITTVCGMAPQPKHVCCAGGEGLGRRAAARLASPSEQTSVWELMPGALLTQKACVAA